MAYKSRNLSKEKRDEILKFLAESKAKAGTADVETLVKLAMVERYVDSETYGLIFEEHSEEVLDRLEKEVPVFSLDETRNIIKDKSGLNFILEGDNLHSLHLLAKTHKHSIDMIYIDPPYNTGAKDWKYNNNYVDKTDGYRHSKWLSMMNERLKIAKNLLTKDGILVCAIDENELATVSLLLEDVFGMDYKVDTVCIVHNPRGVQGDNFSYVNEYALFVYKKGLKVIEDTNIEEDDVDWSQFRNWGTESERSDAKNCFYPVYVDEKMNILGCGEVVDDEDHPEQTVFNSEKNCYEVYPIDKSGVERKWRYATQSFYKIKDMLRAKLQKDGHIEIEIGKTFGSYKTVWTGKKYDANTYGTQLINDMVPTNDFDFPKSLYNVYECLNAVVRNKPNAIVLDFFAGSGTTGHAVLLMNKLIGGNRHFILCTNNDIGEKKEKEFAKAYPHLVNPDKSLVIESDEYKEWEEKYGIARSVTYPRVKAAIEGYKSSSGAKTIIFESKISSKIFLDQTKYAKLNRELQAIIEKESKKYDKVEVKLEDESIRIYAYENKQSNVEGLGGNLVYFKTEFVPQDSEESELRELLMEHIREMICLFEMDDVSDEAIVYTDDELLKLEKDASKFKGKTVFIGPDVLFGDADKNLLLKNGVTFFEIPQLFFENELRKAGEL